MELTYAVVIHSKHLIVSIIIIYIHIVLLFYFTCYIYYEFSAGNIINQVMNVRAHVYKPLLNGDSITAQLIWQQLSQAASYDIRIFTADSSMEMIAVCVCVCIHICILT